VEVRVAVDRELVLLIAELGALVGALAVAGDDDGDQGRWEWIEDFR
jgi:hypothetical protein